MKRRFLLCGFLLALSLAAAANGEDRFASMDPAIREQLFDASYLRNMERYDEAAEIYRRLAGDDNPEAYRQLGIMISDGTYADPEGRDAVVFMELADKHGGDWYRFQSGWNYFLGEYGAPRDKDRAREIAEELIRKDYHGGYDLLSYFERDDKEAVRILLEGVRAGSGSCALRLGVFYIMGRGVEENKGEAHRYLIMAAELDITDTLLILNILSRDFDATSEARLRLARRFEKYCLASSNPDDAVHFLELSECYRKGKHLPKDDGRADFWLEQAKAFGGKRILGILERRAAESSEPDNDEDSSAVLPPDEPAPERRDGEQADAGEKDINQVLFEAMMEEAEKRVAMEDWAAAVSCYESAIDVEGYENHPDALAGLRRARERLDDTPADKRDEAIKAYRNQQYQQAFAALHALRDTDDKLIHLYLAESYFFGRGTDRDYGLAIRFAGKPSLHDEPGARFILGRCYQNGHGVEKDSAAALRHYRVAAERGHPEAQFILGWMHMVGVGTQINYQEAEKWYRPAAEAGDVNAQNNLGLILCYGMGRPKDEAEGMKWLRAASESGDAVTQGNYAVILLNHGNYAEALEMAKKAAVHGDANANFVLGGLYANGYGVPKSDAEAEKYYRLAAEAGHARAQDSLGVLLYLSGRYSEALEWARKAVSQGDISAHNLLGNLYNNGHAVTKNVAEAERLYRIAADGGIGAAQTNLGGLLYSRGEYAEALKWCRLGAESGFTDSMHFLGHMHYEGKGTPQNFGEARRWFAMAVQNGFAGCNMSRAALGY